MIELFAKLLIAIAFIVWGIFLLERSWEYDDDLDVVFFVSIIPVAIALWLGLHLLRI
jgi:hypothetical protein